MGNEILTTMGAARILGCSVERVRQMDDEGKLKSVRTAGGRFRLFQRGDVERLARQRKARRILGARDSKLTA